MTSNDAETVRRLLDEEPDRIRTKTPNGSLLQTAIYHGAADVVAILRERHGPLDLYEAAALGDDAQLSDLLEVDASRVDASNEEGFTPLGLAAFFGHTDAVRVLLAGGASIDATDRSRFANTALDAAVAANRADVVETLLGAGANPNVRAAGGTTPLHKAAFNGNAAIVESLLSRGADPKATDDAGKTPADVATAREHTEIADRLRR